MIKKQGKACYAIIKENKTSGLSIGKTKDSKNDISQLKVKIGNDIKTEVINNSKGGRVSMSPVSIKMREEFMKAQARKTKKSIEVSENGLLVIASSSIGKGRRLSMREQYLEEQGYDID